MFYLHKFGRVAVAVTGGRNCRPSLRDGDPIKWRLTQTPYNSKSCQRSRHISAFRL